MYNDFEVFLHRVKTPLHAGVGTDISAIDMPIQRDKTTNFPKVEGSTFKGCFKSLMHYKSKEYEADKIQAEDIKYIFGDGIKDNDVNNKSAGKLGFTDLNLLFYPIKSRDNLYTLVTCPFILNRFYEYVSLSKKSSFDSFETIKNNIQNLGKGKIIMFGEKDTTFENPKSINLAEFFFSNTEQIGFNEEIKKLTFEYEHLAIMNNSDFADMLELNRIIITRNKIEEETGIVKDGALFTEEYVPEETIFYSLFINTNIYDKDDKFKISIKKIKDLKHYQLGGNSNLGKGIMELNHLE